VTHELAAIKDAATIRLVTYKRDGTGIATPVSLAWDGNRAFFRSYDRAWKTKRLRNTPQVECAAATLSGTPTGSCKESWSPWPTACGATRPRTTN
jgi:uncharacterized protein